jgi:Na+/phosphate symporter
MSDMIEKILKQFNDLLQSESNEKIKRAMQLFIRVDDMYKRIVLHNTGFSGEVTARNLKEHFEILDLMDEIDNLIFNLEDELENA